MTTTQGSAQPATGRLSPPLPPLPPLPVRRVAAARVWRVCLLLLSVSATSLLVLRAPDSVSVTTNVTTALVAIGSWAALAVAESRRAVLHARWLWVAVIVVLSVAVVEPSRGSNDLWSYTVYGRMLAVYHVNPSQTDPNHFPHDPFLPRIGRGWRDTPSVYGPVWNGYSAVGAALAGHSPLRARLFFQITAALGVLAILWLLWRRTRSAVALILVGLNPCVSASIVNGGHNDVLLGVLLLGAVLLVSDRHARLAGSLIGLALLVKVTAGLALIGLVPWVWQRQGARQAGRMMAWVAGLFVIGYGITGTGAFDALRVNARSISRASIWQWPRRWWIGVHRGGGHLVQLAHLATLDRIALLATGCVIGLAVVAVWRRRSESDPAVVAAIAIAAYLFAAGYVLPWYVMWVLPLAVLSRDTRLRWLVAIDAAFLLVVYQLPQTRLLVAHPPLPNALAAYVGSAIALLAFAYLALRPRRVTQGPERPVSVRG